MDYELWDRATLDAAYSNSGAVPEVGSIIADWTRRSAALAAGDGDRLDASYGPGERQRLDWYAGRPGAPLLVFIHGGYWQGQVKETYRFLAEGTRPHALALAILEYTVAPAARMTEMVGEIGMALDWLSGRRGELGFGPLVLAGHSAGGHLTAQWLEHPAVTAGLPISGLFDLDPIARGSLNDKLQLSAEEVERFSPQRHLPERSKPAVVAVGAAELPELVRHSRDYAAARAARGLPAELLEIAGRNHFDILHDLADPDGPLARAVLALSRP